MVENEFQKALQANSPVGKDIAPQPIPEQKDNRRYETFEKICRKKISPLFEVVISEYLQLKVKDSADLIKVTREQVYDQEACLITLELPEDIVNCEKKETHWNGNHNKISLRICMDALIGEAELVEDAYVIATISHIYTKIDGSNHLVPCFSNPVTLHGKGSRGWQQKVQQEILRQLEISILPPSPAVPLSTYELLPSVKPTKTTVGYKLPLG